MNEMENAGLIKENIRQIFCDAELPYQLQVINVQERPEALAEYRVLACPTLLKLEPYPACRLVGNLLDPDLVRQGLRIDTNRVMGWN
jgi:circadian clock protein KaiB